MISIRERWITMSLVILTLLTVGIGYLWSQTITERISIQAKRDLEENWRYQYDILVLPNSVDQDVVLEGGWIPPQSSISSYGGISFEELEKIREIAGVKVAAPLSLIGFYEGAAISTQAANAEKGHFYIIDMEKKVNDGLSDHIVSSSNHVSYYYNEEMEESFVFQAFNREKNIPDGFRVQVPPMDHLRYPNELLIVAIDPEVEEQIYSFEDSVDGGLSSLTEAKINRSSQPTLPFLALSNQEYEVEETLKILKVNIPSEVTEADLLDGSETYLRSLPNEEIVNITIPTFSPEWRHKNTNLYVEKDSYIEDPIGIAPFSTFYKYSSLKYRVLSEQTGMIPEIMAEQVPPPSFKAFSIDFPTYRTLFDENEDLHLTPNIVGYYNPGKIKPIYEQTWEVGDPVDIYTPHHSMIIEDGEGNKIPHSPLIPLPIKSTYYPGAPDMLTTINAARIFYGDTPPLSSIRVIVDGVSDRTAESQRIIEDVAKQIIDKTGLRVEIMLGSAPGKVHVQLEGTKEGQVGKVEEAWQQQGVSWTIEEQVEGTNKYLFYYILFMSLIFCYTVNTHSLLKRSKEFAMLRAIGWSRKKIGITLFLEVLLLTFVSSVLLVCVSAFNSMLDSYEYFLIWAVLFLLTAIGYVSGSVKVLTVSPREGLHGETRQKSKKRGIGISGLGSFILHQMLRRPFRFGLLVIMIAITTLMILLFVTTQQSMSDFLFLSFLGETIDMKLESYQRTFLYVGILLSVLSIGFILILSIVERSSEWTLFRSIGWSRRKIQMFLCIEVGVMGLTGGVLGTLGAGFMINIFTQTSLPAWYYIGAFLLPTLALVLFALMIVRIFGGKSNVLKGHYSA